MELLQLRYFCVLAKHQNVTQAASELMISQPSLSKTLKSLERELGTPLFERSGKYIRLNHMGEIFYNQITQSLQLIDDSVQQLSDLADCPSGQIQLLVLAASTFMTDLYTEFNHKYPHIKMLLSNYVQSELVMYDCDLCISAVEHYTPLPGGNSTPLLSERMVLAVPTDHPFASRSCVDLSEAATMPFIASNRRSDLEQFCAAAGFKPNIVVQCDNGNTYISLLLNHVGITIMPEITLGSMLPPNIVCVPIKNPSPERTVSLSWNPRRYLSAASRLFHDFCIHYFHNLPDKKIPVQENLYGQTFTANL